jgi:hypothetical protein
MTLRLRTVDGLLVEVPTQPRHPLVIGVDITGDLATDLRRAVRADVIRRVADRHRAVARVIALSPPYADVDRLIAETNCRPLLAEDAEPDVVVGDSAAAVVRCVPAADGTPLPARSGLVLRHSLLDGSGPDPAEVSRWQQLVAEWAESPSKPMCAEYVERCDAAADDDVDTTTLLAVMREAEQDAALPPGCKFEMFAHLDAIVGLDLTAMVGQPHHP